MVMCATVVSIDDNSILVLDNATQQEVQVNTCCLNFRQDDRVKIFYNGIMTRSLPPQINADRIIKLNCR